MKVRVPDDTNFNLQVSYKILRVGNIGINLTSLQGC